MAPDSGSSIVKAPRAAQPEAKRRKIRKGTRSCWECKRRKNKCTYSTAGGEGRCDDCRSRGTRCIGQEFPEEQVTRERRGTNKSDENRLQRLETLVEELSRKVDASNACGHHTQLRPDDRSDERTANDMAAPHSHVSSENISDDDRTRTASALQVIRAPAGSSSGQFGQAIGELIAAWPSERYHDAILSSNVVCIHTSRAESLNPVAWHHLTGSASSSPIFRMFWLSNPTLAKGYVAVTTSGNYTGAFCERSKGNDDPCDALGAALDVIESQYYNYMGNIRRAWIVLRRAIAMAQILGLDRQSKSLAYNANTVEARATSRNEGIWFLLVHFDQYVSLMLGISPSLPGNSQIAQGFLERHTPSERMGRLHCMAAGRILQRNRINIYDIVETREIDNILQKAAACMPAQWWLSPDWSTDCGGEGFIRVIERLMVHFAHYNILLQLHLPYMLQSLAGQRFYYSITAVINCSCEILARFTIFRDRHPTVSYCRGLDFFTFIASAALCLLHIYASYESQVAGRCESIGISDLLAHQRYSNRGLLERAFQHIENIAQVESDDKLTLDILPAFRKLLAIEEKAYEGARYNIHLPPNAGKLKRSRGMANNDDTLYLDVPFCGTIRVERANASINPSTEVSGSEQTTQMTHILMGSFPSSLEGCFATNSPIPSAPVSTTDIGEHQLHNANTYALTSPPSDLLPMPYDGNDEMRDPISRSEPPTVEIMDSFEERANPTIDMGFLECLLDIH
ncbi:hypothetical protein EKO27_g4310 [Xylaria grammica]|uniref:Zn(2)-C6 fungal-type domain-containing protein n=1 Tax=Xylaria grammica TaxID=363999 RepID=A0A439D8T6_9PEZI|nr:hypothetical protein EKO27_g4310 [Xylaria grammica]